MKVENITVVEFSDMIYFLMDCHNKTWDEVEEALPSWIYEGDFWLYKDGGNSDGEVFEPLRNWLNTNGIDRVKMYHDN